MAVNLRIYEGFPVLHMLATAEVVDTWRRLFARCPFRTVFARPDVVEAWYRSSAARPVLAVSFDGGEMSGVVPLAEVDGTLTFAGGADFPVHGWLADPLRGSFVLETHVLSAKKDRARARLVPPPGAPDDWLGEGRPLGRGARSIEARRRVIRLDAERAGRPLSKKKNVSQLQDLEAIGRLGLTPAGGLETAIGWYERKRHARGLPPPAQRSRFDLYRALPKDVLETSVLSAGDVPLSAISVYRDGARAYLELLAEDPAFEAFAPGLVHLFLLEEQLVRAGVEELDVTADDDWMRLLAEERPGVRVELAFAWTARVEVAAKSAGRWVLARVR